MTESAQSPEDAASARANEQARLRKERREAKIRAGGSARLNKITGLGGGLQRDPIPQPEPKPQETPSASQQSHDDPAEVDISEHHYEPRTTPRPAAAGSPQQDISEAQLRQMMLGLENPAGAGAGAGAAAGQVPPGMEGMDQDPMFKMLSQMMAAGGSGGGGDMPGAGGPGGPGANPLAGTGLESLLGGLGGLGGAGGFPGMPPSPQQQQQQQAAAAAAKTANLWRILHAVFAVGLGLYVALTTTLAGTQVERDTDGYYHHDTQNLEGMAVESGNAIEQTRAYFFYLFSTVEALLLAARYLTEKERPPPSGILWTVSGFVPRLQPYLRHGLRYFQIFSTVRNDALVCVFVLGVSCWLRS